MGLYHTSLRGRISSFFVLLIFSVSCSGARLIATNAPQSAATWHGQPFFIPGETITWDVSFAGLSGGRARLAVGQLGSVDGRRQIALRAEAESIGLAAVLRAARDSMASWIDVESGLPTRTDSESGSADKLLIVHARRIAGATTASLEILRTGAAMQRRMQWLPAPNTHDPLSLMLALRGWNTPANRPIVMYSLGGLRLWKNVFTLVGREELDGPLGRRATLRIVGVSSRLTGHGDDDRGRATRSYTIWLSDDALRIPVRIVATTELGAVTAQATSYAIP